MLILCSEYSNNDDDNIKDDLEDIDPVKYLTIFAKSTLIG